MCDRFEILHLVFDRYFWLAPQNFGGPETAALDRIEETLVNTAM
jgi:hypothetical protein